MSLAPAAEAWRPPEGTVACEGVLGIGRQALAGSAASRRRTPARARRRGKQAPGRTRRFGARIWRGGKEQRAHEHGARGLVGARAPAHGGGTGRAWQSVSRNCCPSPVALVRYAALKPKGAWFRGAQGECDARKDYSCGELLCLRTLRAQVAAVAVDRQPHR